ncbi:hypothetical protein Tco_0988146 [Tanacetum coccineum]|uniref:Reverse transcriptase domain-containing protein n=1 Tax=Tanacetum coccineum TaxID=301880 RepID=A0ABQ5EQN3_9ASTR
MPFSTYTNLGLGDLSDTRMTIELADRTIKQTKGIATNVLVRIGKFVFPIDFVILDIPKDNDVPLILGRPFLSTAYVKINIYKRKVTLRVGEEKLVFKSVKPGSSIIKRNNQSGHDTAICLEVVSGRNHPVVVPSEYLVDIVKLQASGCSFRSSVAKTLSRGNAFRKNVSQLVIFFHSGDASTFLLFGMKLTDDVHEYELNQRDFSVCHDIRIVKHLQKLFCSKPESVGYHRSMFNGSLLGIERLAV